MQDLGSVQNLYFLEVVGFPIGLSPRTMQDLGSIQNLYFLEVVGFPISLSPRTMQDLGFVQNLYFLDPARISPLAYVWGINFMLKAPRTAHATGASKCSPQWELS